MTKSDCSGCATRDAKIAELEKIAKAAKRLQDNYEYFYLHPALATYHKNSEMAKDLKAIQEALKKRSK